MSNWAEYKIGDFLKRNKRTVSIETDKEYQLLTIKLYHKGILPRQVKSGSDIKAKTMFEVVEGDFILSGIDARNGAFGIVPEVLDGAVVTNDFWYFIVDEQIIDKQFFLELTKTSWFDDLCNKGSDGTTNRIRLQKDKFFNQEVSLPDLKFQVKLRDKLIQFRNGISKASNENNERINLLSKLKQSILHEAVQGKLTAKWRSANPSIEHASELLKRIEAEKQELIAEKKIKKEKLLPPIDVKDKPFALPDGWVWCRMRDISYSIVPNRDKPKTFTGDITWLTTRNLDEFSCKIKHKLDDKKLSKDEVISYNARLLPVGSVIMSCVGRFGYSAVLEEESSCNQQLHCYVPLGLVNPNYIDSIIKNSRKTLMLDSSATTIAYLNKTKCDSLIVSLPPLEEQKVIVEKVNSLMALSDKLAQEIDTSQIQIEQLMQSCLKEVFEVDEELV